MVVIITGTGIINLFQSWIINSWFFFVFFDDFKLTLGQLTNCFQMFPQHPVIFISKWSLCSCRGNGRDISMTT